MFNQNIIYNRQLLGFFLNSEETPPPPPIIRNIYSYFKLEVRSLILYY